MGLYSGVINATVVVPVTQHRPTSERGDPKNGKTKEKS